MKDHVVFCGYGTKGRSAIRALRATGVERDQFVVIESDHEAIEAAAAAGYATVHGTSTSDSVLREAEVGKARSVIVAVDRDDAAVLTTLTVRQIAPDVTLVAAVREAENADLLIQGGATSVITSSDAAGRLLGIATERPSTVAVVEDLIAFGHGLDLLERELLPDEVGKSARAVSVPVLAVVRGGRNFPFDDPQVSPLQRGDRLVYVSSPRDRED